MQSYTRRQLKQDRFVEATNEAVHWTVEHRNTLITAAVVIALAIAAFAGWSFYQSKQEEQASMALGKAVRTYDSPLRQSSEATDPDAAANTFATAKDRASAAYNEFLQIADKYPHSKNGHYARYMAGVTAIDKGDNAAAEQQLKRAADTDKDTSALANFALANLYRSQAKTDEAAKLYREVIEDDRVAVPKTEAQKSLAEMYERKNPAEAVKVYEQIIKQEQEKAREFLKQNPDPKAKLEDLKSPLQQEAEAKIAQLKSAAGKK